MCHGWKQIFQVFEDLEKFSMIFFATLENFVL